MGEVLEFTEKAPDNLLLLKPWEFRWADWESKHFIQMLRSQSAKLETHRKQIRQKGEKGVWHLPPHYVLKGGMAHTIRAAYRYRENEERMREVYYLAGLIDCMTNQVNPLLRTDLIRDMYKKIMTLKGVLSINWYGTIDQVLFPIDMEFYNEMEYKDRLSKTDTMKGLYALIREGTDEMFDILSLEYVFYTPGRVS